MEVDQEIGNFDINQISTIFSARQHMAFMLSTLYAIVRPSVRPSVSLTDGSYKNGWR